MPSVSIMAIVLRRINRSFNGFGSKDVDPLGIWRERDFFEYKTPWGRKVALRRANARRGIELPLQPRLTVSPASLMCSAELL